ncbi:protein high chlorophyll fluorescent 107-like [Chenopodium quinoa]|uniref:protein high chlorophyll fluorescent 107-like n=1 Tax=Chenopodium quinoa TaxID=63459 RepID=UPI000B77CE5F|nr:protein high chlorophyll fluorescent 107-like [Chenopodium quinoa]
MNVSVTMSISYVSTAKVDCWAVLESDLGNTRKARELFDADFADKKHIAAWHGWAVLQLKQGNIKKARNLLGKGNKYCGGNEYVYQTLALLEAKANRYEQASYLFRQATRCNPKSCASWLAWAQLEMQQENNQAACYLFKKLFRLAQKIGLPGMYGGYLRLILETLTKQEKF